MGEIVITPREFFKPAIAAKEENVLKIACGYVDNASAAFADSAAHAKALPPTGAATTVSPSERRFS